MADASLSNVTQKPIRLVQATGVVMVATLASAAFGLLRETLLAAKFGTSLAMDAYFFSFDLIISLPVFLLAAFQASLIPLYTKSKEEGGHSPFVNTVINSYLVFLLLVAIIILTCAPFAVATLGSGFSEASQHTVTRMIRLLSPAVMLVGLWGVFRSLLNAEGEFFVSTISQSLLSIAIIGVLVSSGNQGGIYNLVMGVLMGCLAQVAWTAYWLIRRKAFQYRPRIDLSDPRFQRFLNLLGPGLIGGIIGYLIPMVDKWFASYLPVGTIASLGFAARPMSILSRIAVYSFVTALLPALSLEALKNSRDRLTRTVIRTLGMVMFVTTPLSILLAILRVPIIQLLFERGNFTATDAMSTANIFAGLAVGLMPMAIAVTLSTVFVSLEDTKTPAYFGAGSNLIAKVVFSLILVAPLGAIGLALSTSLKYVVSCIVLYFMLNRRLPGIGLKPMLKNNAKIISASLLAASPVYWLATYSKLQPLLLLVTGVLLGATFFLFSSAVLRVPELTVVRDQFLRPKGKRLFNGFLNHGRW